MESWSTRAPPESSDNSMCPTWTSRPREEDMPDSSWGRKRSMSTKWGRATIATNMAATRVAATFMPLLFITPLLENLWTGINHRPSLSSATNPEKRGQKKAACKKAASDSFKPRFMLRLLFLRAPAWSGGSAEDRGSR